MGLGTPDRDVPHWSQNPERSNLFWLRFMTWLSLKLGRAPSRVVLYGIAAYFLAFAPTARRASRVFLQRALNLRAGMPPGWRHQFRHFLSFATAIHDRVFLLNDRYDLFDIRVHNQSLINNLIARGQGAFMIGAHMGSFEVLRAVGRQQPNLQVAMGMYEENARKINATLGAINPKALQGIVALGTSDSMIQVHTLLEKGTVVGMLADRSLGDDDTLAVDFLGAPAHFPVGPFRMAAIMKCPIVFMTGLYSGANRYDIYFEPLADFTNVTRNDRKQKMHETVTRYAALMEQYCRQSPYNWFNFFDFWRVKEPHPGKPSTKTA